jgi:hypothetical protein
LQLPDFPPISGETLEAIGERYELRAGEISPSKDAGIFNAIRLAGHGRIYTQRREPGPNGAMQIDRRFRSIFATSVRSVNTTIYTAVLAPGHCTLLIDIRHEPLRLDPSAGWC